MASLPTPQPKGAEFVRRGGKGWEAKMPGIDDHLPLDHNGVHLDANTQFDPGGDQPMVGLHGAYHGGALPPSLMKAIEAFIQQYLDLHNIHEFAGSPNAMPGGEPPPPPDAGMPPPPDIGGGLPTPGALAG